MQNEPNGFLDLWAREHYKSTIITFGLTIQDILRSHGDDAPDPVELCFLILSQTRPNAKKFLGQHKTEFETNRDLIELFPDIFYDDPINQAPHWSLDDGISVKRKGNPKEQTIEASGLVDGQPSGPHFPRLLYDDTVTLQSVTTPDMIKKTTTAWEMSQNLGTEGGVARYIGTFYAYGDTYHTMIERGIRVRKYPATKDGTDDTRPENCVLHSSATLTKKRREGSTTFWTQMLLDPKGGRVTGFKESELRYWPREHAANLTRCIIGDPASKKKKTSDYTAIWVLGLGSDNNWYIIDLVKDRLNLQQRVKTLLGLHRQWEPAAVFWEEYGLQADIEAAKWEMDRQNYRFEIYPLGGKMKKEDRIKRLQPLAENHRLWMPEGGCVHTNYEGVAVDTIRTFIKDEWNAFPVCAHDDGLDGLSRIEDEIVKSMVFKPSAPAPVQSDFEAELAAEYYASSRGPNSWLGR